ncbi:hypothetical protein DQX05_08495 [Paenibacillus thiaminolyticus]|uniref:Uncharacterized protein n=1 Tax=Paenibacillus thiaminolyticus TaxID=49283 RepID=A0A3A3GK56_PANTH|nr:hypothetical protein DQX05_08495 [Paenibacillus thiaminolyticus]
MRGNEEEAHKHRKELSHIHLNTAARARRDDRECGDGGKDRKEEDGKEDGKDAAGKAAVNG